LNDELPPLAHVAKCSRLRIPPRGGKVFRIRRSKSNAPPRAQVTPDAATCQDCLADLFYPPDCRHRYPFINCTNCGPRYSIIRAIPYDRPATTMSAFEMCRPCHQEYVNEGDRRFHAQPIACPDCGPQLQLVDRLGSPVSGDPIKEAANCIRSGLIIAIKGIGGYHLACRADDQKAVETLRRRKIRNGKPLAVMTPSMTVAQRLCQLDLAHRKALGSPAAPIVLAPKRKEGGLAPAIAPNCRHYGLMMPYTPMHHLLFAEGLGSLVMTSANRSGEPLTFQDDEAQTELADVADVYLMHDREIFRPLDDSVVIAFRNAVVPIRRARGYVPRPIWIEGADSTPILAVGGDLKNTVCLLFKDQAIISEHLGELSGARAYRHFCLAIERLEALFEFDPEVVAHDLHPHYMSTQFARVADKPRIPVQHHHAHIASVMAEWGDAGPVIGVACDGAGYGTDGAIWGCEILKCHRGDFERIGQLSYFPLVGGDAAAVKTWRPAAALLRKAFGSDWLATLATDTPELAERFARIDGIGLFDQQCAGGINTPPTSSLGRVFDAVAFLLGLCDRNRHEAEAAMALEACAAKFSERAKPYRFSFKRDHGFLEFSVASAIRDIVEDLYYGVPKARISASFHETIAQMLTRAAVLACQLASVKTVAVSGGCFANTLLLSRIVELLEENGLRVLYHRQVPPGDGGLSLGQAYVAMHRTKSARNRSN
jgi:hydrogenase maturation protein HypF